MKLEQCGNCGELVCFTTTTGGDRIPVEITTKPVGTVKCTDVGAITVGEVQEGPERAGLYRSHLERCPDAVAWRRRGSVKRLSAKP